MQFPTYDFPFGSDEKVAKVVRLNNPDTYPFDHLHAHEFNEIMVFVKGGGVHCLDFCNQQITHQSIHVIAAGDPHWVERGQNSSGFAIVLKDEFLDHLSFFNASVPYLSLFASSRIIILNDEE